MQAEKTIEQILARGKDYTGERFAHVTVIGFAGIKMVKPPGTQRIWKCRCDCGEEFTRAIPSSDKARNAMTCGCARVESARKRFTKHRHTIEQKPLYTVWAGMKARCRDVSNSHYRFYGGRGIVVCDRWLDFHNFFCDMSEGYRPGVQLDRINVDGNYEPGNVRWATKEEQSINRRNSCWITINGDRKHINEWSKLSGLHPETIRRRFKTGVTGMDILSHIRLPRRTKSNQPAAIGLETPH